MKISDVILQLENLAHPSLQESYDNCGLITGNELAECTGILVALDATEAVIAEALMKGCNMVVVHHPIVFSGLKKITGKNYVERTVIAAIKKEIAIYAIHTNLDNVLQGVNSRIAEKLELTDCRILLAKNSTLKKLITYVPVDYLDKVRDAVFSAGGGTTGNYAECSFVATGTGSFKANKEADPFVGEVGERHYEKEAKLEVVFEAWKEKQLLNALIKSHPYEEVVYDIISIGNVDRQTGSGIIGELDKSVDEMAMLEKIKKEFGLAVIRHTPLRNKKIKRVAVCGGAGSFLIKSAIAAGADLYITADIKYHEFFDAEGQVVLADIGHYESEQFTIDLLADFLENKFPTFAVLKTGVKTNPVQYY